MSWDLSLSITILTGFSLSTWLFVNKEGYKHALIYTLFCIVLYFNESLFMNIAPIFLLVILLLNPTEIKGSLIFALVLVALSATNSSVAIAQTYSGNVQDVFLLRDLTAGTSAITAMVFVLPTHKDYPISLTFCLFAICFYSYANPYSPLVQVAFPFACLSLIPYLCMTVINNYSEGSIAYRLQLRILRTIARRLKIKDKSKYSTLAVAILKL